MTQQTLGVLPLDGRPQREHELDVVCLAHPSRVVAKQGPSSSSLLSCCFQDNAVVLSLIETVDVVMNHISSNLHTSEPQVTIVGSSSMAGTWQVGGEDRWCR